MRIRDNFFIFTVLIQRDLRGLGSNLKNIVIDAVILSSFFALVYGRFFPALGMAVELSFPLALGHFVNSIISTSFHRSMAIKSDLEFKKFINYQITLPLSKNWLIAEYITSFTIDLVLSMLPVLILTIILLSSMITFQVNFIAFILIYFLSALFFANFMLTLVFIFDWQWFVNNTWERILNPIIQFGCIFYVWKKLIGFSLPLTVITLFSPITYVSEGLRASILGSEDYLPMIVSISVLLVLDILMIIPLYKMFNKKLDLI